MQRIGLALQQRQRRDADLQVLADRAFVMLRDAIVTAEIKPGQRLRLDEIAERLGMSVMPAREALKRLEEVR